ncbi:hypothetical protein GRI89_12925 [Altererythrobacter salegens]|uniref:Uncharacterized protein n=1 Tax=Croceibacterium salegens TaxID=1737568 RepID=A0A6I4SWU4_9SPHN|nr:hypothetical protein [Croceibacterium salegens]MXO60441.1 hypothetical protein [Croceibacterium salegens]
MSIHFTEIAAQAAADGVITPDEILALRREGWGDGQMIHEEAEAIFAIDAALAERPAAWCDFLVKAIGEYVLNTWEPRGYVTDEQGEWLAAKVTADGRIDSMTELELLVRVVERAKNVPDQLKHLVLDEVERAVMSGQGPTRKGGELKPHVVTEADCRTLRRTIFAPGGDRPAAVSREEAEMLFRIKDATLDKPNAPEWKQLFVQGVGNYLQGYVALSAQLSRERAAELEAFMNDSESNVGRFIGRMAKGAPNAFGVVFGKKGAEPSRDQLAIEAEAVTPDEQQWLEDRIIADDRVDELEQALLAFVSEEISHA